MKTRAVNNATRFFNIFTRQGRKINNIYKKFNENGMGYIRERTLRDKSRVILGYENPASPKNSFAFKINPDFKIEQKSYEKSTVLNLFNHTNRSISKIWMDENDKVIDREVKNMRFRDNKLIGRMKYFLSEKLLKQSYEGAFTDLIESHGRPIKKAYRRLVTSDGRTDLYSIFEYADGTKEYKKHINGIEYIFSTLKK